MRFPEGSLFLGIRPGIDAVRTSIVADPVIDCRVIMHDHRIVDINIMNNRTIYIHDGRIIPESISLPSASAEP